MIIVLVAGLTVIATLFPARAEIGASHVRLAPSSKQLTATRLITQVISNFHYKKTPLDDQLSATMLDRYLSDLDPNRSYFLDQDIEGFQVYRNRLDDSLRDAQLDAAFDIFGVFQTRLAERVRYALAALEHGFDFKIDESYLADRSDAPWASSPGELDNIWRRRVKNDVLNLRLAGKSEKEIVDTLRKRYRHLGKRATQLTSDDVYQIFINAYTASVEPHTAYFSPRISEDFEISMSLSLEGIGAALHTVDEHTVVQRVIAGGPAAISGQLNSEDKIIAVAQGAEGRLVDVVGWRLRDVVDLIRGPKGSVVRLQLLPSGAEQGAPVVIALTRDEIKLEDMAANKSVIEVGGGPNKRRIGVIKVPSFYVDVAGRGRGDTHYSSTTRDVLGLIESLSEEEIDGFIVDLRGNGGGSLEEAINLTGLFINTGPVVQVRNSTGRIDIHRDNEPGVAYAGPLAVVVDRQSASASEIFAGAMQDYGRGIIVGEPTFGKGTVQQLINLDRFVRGSEGNLGQLKTTIAQFFRITGGSTQHRGVIPDIEFPTGRNLSQQGERAFTNALPWDHIRPAKFLAHASITDQITFLRQQHLARISADPLFQKLRQQSEVEVSIRNKDRVTLLESRRKTEFKRAQDGRQEKGDLLPFTKGKDSASKDSPMGKDAAVDHSSDAFINEAAHILRDLIEHLPMQSPTLRTAGVGARP
jgi:carboxyl-terminal processing protease